MRLLKQALGAGLVCVGVSGVGTGWGQAAPTATESLQLTAFAGATGVDTGLNAAYGISSEGRNASITAGVAAGIRPYFSLFPSVEIRGTYPVGSGQVAGEKSILGGLVVAKHFGRLQPYGDIFFGRGELSFVKPYPNISDTELYVQSASAVWSPGAGANFFVRGSLGVKVDFQLQRYASPVTASGSVYSKALTLGVIYRIGGGGLSRVGR